ncbi:MAG: c-type cytochrome biogenesis protein CcmI [Rhizobiaceae bacterium]|nr:c-type cytochrome biogenesis protein CcmI [Rhizobiaceae bacterium]
MLFLIVAALLTVGASLAVLLPLTKQVSRVATADAHDIEVYRDQLQELERDAGRGLIAPAEAVEARTEIARRLLRISAGGDTQADRHGSPLAARAVGVAAVLAVPLVSWGLYATLGSPTLPDAPLSARLAENPKDQSIDELVARAEAHLAGNPEDGRGWDVLAPIYARMQRQQDAVAAYRHAIRLLGDSAERQAGLGEALAGMAAGLVTAEASAALRRAIELDPANSKARFFLAVAMAQDGRLAEAKAAWQAMAAALPENDAWRGAAENAVAEADRRLAAASPAQQPAPGPTQQDIDAAAELSSQDRTAMIETMVAGLDARLRENPQDEEGWARLIRSYVVLGKSDEAGDALKRGVAALDGAAAARLTTLAASLGLVATE